MEKTKFYIVEIKYTDKRMFELSATHTGDTGIDTKEQAISIVRELAGNNRGTDYAVVEAHYLTADIPDVHVNFETFVHFYSGLDPHESNEAYASLAADLYYFDEYARCASNPCSGRTPQHKEISAYDFVRMIGGELTLSQTKVRPEEYKRNCPCVQYVLTTSDNQFVCFGDYIYEAE